MPKRKTSKPSQFERSYKILEYLKRNSDCNHTITQASLRKEPDTKEYIGDKETYNADIARMAHSMNYDSELHDYKPEEDWRIVFKEFSKRYGRESDEDFEEDESDKKMKIRGLYYQHVFSYDEINSLIEGILFSKTIDSKTADKLIGKIENNLTTKYYPKNFKKICKIREPILMDQNLLRKNLSTIQQAIDDKVRISFQFNGYSFDKKLRPSGKKKYIVSPFYIVANGGRYYLLACMEWGFGRDIKKEMSIWRIDLMTELTIPKRNEKKGFPGIPALKKEEVKNLPLEWNEKFQLSHLNMSFDQPVRIKLRIKSPKKDGNPKVRVRADYTFMHDWFGDTFRYITTEKEPPYDDIVEVKCSPFAMENWALQYSDRVEVLEPREVRSAVIEKLRMLWTKYGLDEK